MFKESIYNDFQTKNKMRKLLRQAIEEQKKEEKLKERLKLPFNYTKQIYQDWIDKEKRR